jgi:hypothetical protein
MQTPTKASRESWNFSVGIVQTEGIKPSDFMLNLIKRKKRRNNNQRYKVHIN